MKGQNDGWMKPRESPKGKMNTDYPPNSITLEPDHVNGVRRSRANEVMGQWKDMMIKSLLCINTSKYRPIKCKIRNKDRKIIWHIL